MAEKEKKGTSNMARSYGEEWEMFSLTELAQSVMTGILGINFRARFAEKQKENPDIEKIN